jgi:flagella basal body P-ring formation protein FlgA
MCNKGGWPLGWRRAKWFLVLAIILPAWSGQAALAANIALAVEPAAGQFVAGRARLAAGGTLEIRAEATIVGPEVLLRQICRWSDADAHLFAPIADLVIARLDGRTPFRGITYDEIRNTLHDAGVNLAVIKFAGPMTCTVTRSDTQRDRGEALDQWITARQANIAPAEERVAAPAVQEAPTPAADQDADKPKTLRQLLIADLAQRLDLPVESLQMSFSVADEPALNLAGPHFRFQIEGRRVRNLCDVNWEVTILSEGGSRRLAVNATARAWQQQVVAMRPIAFKQLIQAGDVQERRALIDRLSDDPLLTIEQTVGQQTARELKPGTVLTARMVEAVPLVRTGQLVTVVLQQGGVQIKTVARALEAGAFGQSIRVRNEATKDVFEVVLTGPQTARMGGDPINTASANVASIGE